MTAGTGLRIVLHATDTGTDAAFTANRLVIAGYTGADMGRTRRHIDELAAHGISPPPRLPMFYDVAPGLLTFGTEIAVDSAETSGEVEPVLYCTPYGWYVGVGSDHTARDLERTDIAHSKGVCPKVASREVVSYAAVAPRWGSLRLRSFVDEERHPYQDAAMSEILSAEDILAAYQKQMGAPPDGLVMFLGTIPLLGGEFRYAGAFTGELTDPGGGLRLTCSYRVMRRS